MKRLVPLLCLWAGSLSAVELMPVVVEGETLPATQGEDPLDEKMTLTREGIELFGPAAQTDALEALQIEPGIVVEATDPYGLGAVTARDRGIDSNFMALTIDGVPNYSIRPIGPRTGLYDLENLERIDHYRGALSPETGPGVGAKAGMIALHWMRPAAEATGRVATRFGSDDFYKLYGRADTGEIGGNLRAFVSASRADAEKWKGEGDLGPRTNVAVGVVAGEDALPVELFYNHTSQKSHDFMGLTYDQIQSLSTYYDTDYQSSDRNASDYYDYHKHDERYDEVQLGMKGACFGGSCGVKLYAADYLEKSDEGDGKGTVDGRRIGMSVFAMHTFGGVETEAGIWGERGWLDKYVEKVKTDPTRAHVGWKWLNKNHGPDEMLAPYLRAATDAGAFRLEAGLRYLYYKAAANDTYLGNNPASDYDTAIATGTIAPGGAVGAMTYREWLPSFGVRYALDEANELFAKWGRGYQRPYRYSFAAKYAANSGGIRDKLLSEGKDLESVIEQWKMETSDLYDVGIRSYVGTAELTLTGFYHHHYNLLSTAYDPSLGIDYLQNVGDATVYGVELQSSIEPVRGLWLYVNPAWMQSRLNKNLAMSGSQYDLKGNEVPETPHWTVKAGGAYRFYGGHVLSLSARYIGERYADVENEQKVPGYTTADLRYDYTHGFGNGTGEWHFFASVLNLTDEEYVASVGSADLLDDTPTYYVGAPRSFIVGLEARF